MENKIMKTTAAVVATLTAVAAFNTDFDAVMWTEAVHIIAGAVGSLALLFAKDPGKK